MLPVPLVVTDAGWVAPWTTPPTAEAAVGRRCRLGRSASAGRGGGGYGRGAGSRSARRRRVGRRSAGRGSARRGGAGRGGAGGGRVGRRSARCGECSAATRWRTPGLRFPRTQPWAQPRKQPTTPPTAADPPPGAARTAHRVLRRRRRAGEDHGEDQAEHEGQGQAAAGVQTHARRVQAPAFDSPTLKRMGAFPSTARKTRKTLRCPQWPPVGYAPVTFSTHRHR